MGLLLAALTYAACACSGEAKLNAASTTGSEAPAYVPEPRTTAILPGPSECPVHTDERRVLQGADAASLDEHCARGSLDACLIVGARLRDGRRVARKDYPTAIARFTQVCEAGWGEGCVALSAMHARGHGAAKSARRSGELARQGCEELERSCAERCAEDCGAFANLCLDPYTGKQPRASEVRARAAELLAKACEAGRLEACIDAGARYLGEDTGSRVESPDPGRASELFGHACEGGLLAGCNAQAALFGEGGSMTANPQRAEELYTRVCYQQSACEAPVEYPAERAICRTALANGCCGLGRIFERTKQDQATAIDLYTRANHLNRYACPDYQLSRK